MKTVNDDDVLLDLVNLLKKQFTKKKEYSSLEVAQTIFHNVLDSIVIVGQSSKDPKRYATAITDELLHNVGTMTESLAALKHRISEGLYDDKESEGKCRTLRR